MKEQKELIKILKEILEIKKKYKASVELLNGEIITMYGEEQSKLLSSTLKEVDYYSIKQIKLERRNRKI